MIVAVSRRLRLLRHAKAVRGDPFAGDHDRALAPRGRRACAALAEHLRRTGVSPQLVLCSSARRAVETLDGVRPGLPDRVAASVEPGLYGASVPALLQRLREVGDDVTEVLVIGHNPGLEDLAGDLAGGGDPALAARLRERYPTGGLVTLGFTGPWRGLGPGAATLDGFVTPGDLT